MQCKCTRFLKISFSNASSYYINPLQPGVAFLYPLKKQQRAVMGWREKGSVILKVDIFFSDK